MLGFDTDGSEAVREPLPIEKLSAIPRLGWIQGPSPVEELGELAQRLGLGSLHVKRDDLIPVLGGGTKPRKLDYLLAQPMLAQAETWHSVGAIGSGHLVAVAQAARALGRRLVAHCFHQTVTEYIEQNLALIASGPTVLRYYRTRSSLALWQPTLVLPSAWRRRPIVPPGGTTESGMVGLVRAALELGSQVRAGLLPEPERVYVALGSGGTAAGLSVGLALAGLRSRVRAVAVVERLFTAKARLDGLRAALCKWLVDLGVMEAAHITPGLIEIDRSQLGPGYGTGTPASRNACDVLSSCGLHLEEVYTGKAMAALLHDAEQAKGEHFLFWHTARGQLPDVEDGWRERLPRKLQRDLGRGRAGRGLTRRQLVVGGSAAIGAGLLAWHRLGFYPELDGWRGVVLSPREAFIVSAAAEAIVPIEPLGPTPIEIAAHVDRYLVGLPNDLIKEIHLLLHFIEQGTPIGLKVARFTRLAPTDRDELLGTMSRRRGLVAQAYRGIRDLCMAGYYQDPRAWRAIGYSGPWIGIEANSNLPSEESPLGALRAPAGANPRGVLR
ncbi:MAG: pyridoxal-phosphate dependent enzyme [Deltaproteobacteria bacterium]|nr:pyridoxal-phosphate dependent enzyme [Deltaproteobacteria bacterium]